MKLVCLPINNITFSKGNTTQAYVKNLKIHGNITNGKRGHYGTYAV